jgi:hypothetical protein
VAGGTGEVARLVRLLADTTLGDTDTVSEASVKMGVLVDVLTSNGHVLHCLSHVSRIPVDFLVVNDFPGDFLV